MLLSLTAVCGCGYVYWAYRYRIKLPPTAALLVHHCWSTTLSPRSWLVRLMDWPWWPQQWEGKMSDYIIIMLVKLMLCADVVMGPNSKAWRLVWDFWGSSLLTFCWQGHGPILGPLRLVCEYFSENSGDHRLGYRVCALSEGLGRKLAALSREAKCTWEHSVQLSQSSNL